MKKLITILTFAGLLMQTTEGLAQGPGSAGLPFLLIAPGARAAGMGESFVSIADDATATYWNTAGMAFQERTQIALMHANWLPQLASDLYYDYATVVHPLKNVGTVGLAVTYINLGEQVITGEEGPEPLGTFSSNELAIAGSFSTKIGKNNSVGIGLKFIYSNLSPQSAGAQEGDGRTTGFALDLGYLHKNLLIKKLNFGVNLTNLGPKVTYIDAEQADPLPTNLHLGFSYHLINQQFNSLRLATEVTRLIVSHNDEGKADPVFKALFRTWSDEGSFSKELDHFLWNLGAEYWYNNFVALRAGYHYDKEGRAKYATFGAGLRYASLGLDFGYISAGEGHPLSDTMRFSLSLDL